MYPIIKVKHMNIKKNPIPKIVGKFDDNSP